MRQLLQIAPLLLIGFSAPAIAGKKEDQIAACMWQRMPQSAEKFVAAATPQEETRALFEGLAVCAEGDLTVNTRALKRRLAETRPAEISENTEEPALFICTRDAEGQCEASE